MQFSQIRAVDFKLKQSNSQAIHIRVVIEGHEAVGRIKAVDQQRNRLILSHVSRVGLTRGRGTCSYERGATPGR